MCSSDDTKPRQVIPFGRPLPAMIDCVPNNMSGSYLKDTAAVVEASVGKGELVLYGPEILFRAQPHGTLKLLFDGIFAEHAQLIDLK